MIPKKVTMRNLLLNPTNTKKRTDVNRNKFKSFKRSVSQYGLLKKPIAVPCGKNKFKLLDGNRGVTALRELGYEGEITIDVRTPAERSEIPDEQFVNVYNTESVNFNASDFLERYINSIRTNNPDLRKGISSKDIKNIEYVIDVADDSKCTKIEKHVLNKGKSITTVTNTHKGICKRLGVTDKYKPELIKLAIEYLFLKPNIIEIREKYKKTPIKRLENVIRKKIDL